MPSTNLETTARIQTCPIRVFVPSRCDWMRMAPLCTNPGLSDSCIRSQQVRLDEDGTTMHESRPVRFVYSFSHSLMAGTTDLTSTQRQGRASWSPEGACRRAGGGRMRSPLPQAAILAPGHGRTLKPGWGPARLTFPPAWARMCPSMEGVQRPRAGVAFCCACVRRGGESLWKRRQSGNLGIPSRAAWPSWGAGSWPRR